MGANDFMRVDTRGGDENGFGYVSFYQEHHGRMVVGSGFNLSTLGGRVISGTGRVVPELGQMVEPTVRIEEALKVVRKFAKRRWNAIRESDIDVTSPQLVYTSVHSTWSRGSWVLAHD